MAMVPASNINDVSDLCSLMAVDDPDEGGAVFDEEDILEEVVELRWHLLDRFQTDKSFHFHLLQNTLAPCGSLLRACFFEILDPIATCSNSFMSVISCGLKEGVLGHLIVIFFC